MGQTCSACIVKRAEVAAEAQVKAEYKPQITTAWGAALLPILLAAARICAAAEPTTTAEKAAAAGDGEAAAAFDQATVAAHWDGSEVDSLMAEQAEKVRAARASAKVESERAILWSSRRKNGPPMPKRKMPY